MRLFKKSNSLQVHCMVHLFAGADVVGGHLEACGEWTHCVAVLTLSLNKCAICKGWHAACVHTSLSGWLRVWEWALCEGRARFKATISCSLQDYYCRLVWYWVNGRVSCAASVQCGLILMARILMARILHWARQECHRNTWDLWTMILHVWSPCWTDHLPRFWG